MQAATVLAAVRTVHFGAVIVLFGQFAYAWAVAPHREAPPAFRAMTAWSAALIVATGIAWLALEAIGMSGLPPAEALAPGTIAVVVAQTLFGRVWLVRMALAAAIAVALWRLAGSPRDERHGATFTCASILSLLLLLSLAPSGHAAGGRGVDGALRLCADGLHLLCAGAWLGGLVPLIAALRPGSQGDDAARLAATRRFSTLGIASVAAILLSGIVNAAYTVDDFSTTLDTRYGELLVTKVAVFAVIVGFAAVNRMVLMPRAGLRALQRNAIAECVLGFCIIAIVGELGITIPAAHHH